MQGCWCLTELFGLVVKHEKYSMYLDPWDSPLVSEALTSVTDISNWTQECWVICLKTEFELKSIPGFLTKVVADINIFTDGPETETLRAGV